MSENKIIVVDILEKIANSLAKSKDADEMALAGCLYAVCAAIADGSETELLATIDPYMQRLEERAKDSPPRLH